MFYKNRQAFTLIEIIVVLVILGVLASIALPNIYSWIEKSRLDEALETAGAIKAALEPQFQKIGGSICAGNGNWTPNPPYDTLALSIVDSLAPSQYFLAGTADAQAQGANPNQSVGCWGSIFFITIDRNPNQIGGSDPCQNGPCTWSACGITNAPDWNSGIVMCRDNSGNWGMVSTGLYQGMV